MTQALLPALLLVAAAPGADPASRCVQDPVVDLTGCSVAIAAENDSKARARLLMIRAYGLVEKGELDQAIADLNEAIRLDPDFPDAYHERAYVWGELREFGRGLADSDREVELRPDHAAAYEERAYLRHRAGDLAGAFQDRARVVELRPGDPDALLSRGRAALWMGRFEEATRDTDEALRLARAQEEEEATKSAEEQLGEIALWIDSSAGAADELCKDAFLAGANRPRIIGDCTAAFLGASSKARKAEMVSIRALAWFVGRQDPARGTADQEVAVGLDPGNENLRATLGGYYVRAGQSRAGLRELDRSIALKETWPALAQRAAAKHDLRDPEGAFADAKRSFEIRPNEVALIVLGDLFRDKGDTTEAKAFWMAAYRMGSRDDGTFERLKSVGIDRPDQEPAPR